MNDILNSGSSTIVSGRYNNIRLSGRTHINGDIECESLRVSGSCASDGKISCPNGEVVISGAFQSEGDLTAKEASVSGRAAFGSFSGGIFKCSGRTAIGGHIKCEEITITGTVDCGTDINAEKISVYGKCIVNGMICGENIKLEAMGSAESVGGSIIKINTENTPSLLHAFTASSIEGDDIELNHTVCDVVRGGKVKIGSKSEIGCVEYTESCEIDDMAKIGELRKCE